MTRGIMPRNPVARAQARQMYPPAARAEDVGRNGIQLGSDASNVGRVPVFSCTLASHALHSVPLEILSARWASASVPIAAVSPDFDCQRQSPEKSTR
jgi:hypothetical protein